ncbi:programmed cell death 1 ligand 2 isoform X2 [Echinops telfairi]|uniref:Programmed cell death 1 ligand 2 isoform X2 n=1 Tax=Echinops telfairi TaxID=9371 RepID=A0AC55D0J2_ECHTE|nr:programmed cell death 1 ligand 2 isoform X2 [Echinops telfairi]
MFVLLLTLSLGAQLRQTAALFTVTVPREHYVVDHGSNVTLECDFDTGGPVDLGALTAQLQKMKNNTALPNEKAVLLQEPLDQGQALFHIARVLVSDAGRYRCLIVHKDAWDYKYLTLEVRASYKHISTSVHKVPGTDEVELTCQAEGYPLAEVIWPNVSIPANTSHTKTPEGLYWVTSVLQLKPQPGQNFSCAIWNVKLKEWTWAIIDLGDLRTPKSPTSPLLLIPIFIVVFLLLTLMIVRRKRLCQKLSPRKDLSGGLGSWGE